MAAYLARKRWEHRTLAVAVINTYAEAMSSGKKGNAPSQSNATQVDGGTMLQMLGAGKKRKKKAKPVEETVGDSTG